MRARKSGKGPCETAELMSVCFLLQSQTDARLCFLLDIGLIIATK